MSNNTKRRGDVEDKEQIEFRQILEKLLKDPDNKKCADCGTAAPRWASATLGVFLCIKCSGVHRSMGTHISFIRSVSLDRWKPEEITFIQSMGNANAALIWEAKLPAEYRRPSTNDSLSLEKFIRDKYEHKRYYKPPAADRSANNNHITIKHEVNSSAPTAHSGVLQPPNRSPLTAPGRPITPQRANPTPVLVDPFQGQAVNNKTATSAPFPQPFPQQQQPNTSQSLFPADFPGSQNPTTKLPESQQFQQPTNTASAVDVNLLKKSNIMSMFDVQTEQQQLQQQQQQQQQQMLLQQQLYYSGSPQLYYTTSGGLIPVMYSAQSYGPTTVVYPQHFQ